MCYNCITDLSDCCTIVFTAEECGTDQLHLEDFLALEQGDKDCSCELLLYHSFLTCNLHQLYMIDCALNYSCYRYYRILQ